MKVISLGVIRIWDADLLGITFDLFSFGEMFFQFVWPASLLFTQFHDPSAMKEAINNMRRGNSEFYSIAIHRFWLLRPWHKLISAYHAVQKFFPLFGCCVQFLSSEDQEIFNRRESNARLYWMAMAIHILWDQDICCSKEFDIKANVFY